MVAQLNETIGVIFLGIKLFVCNLLMHLCGYWSDGYHSQEWEMFLFSSPVFQTPA